MSIHQLHHREQPEAWSRLLSFADQAFTDSPEPSAGAAVLHHEIGQLSNLELEKNYTYGLGKIMCEMAIHLAQPEQRTAIVRQMAERLVLSALERDVPFGQPFQPMIEDLNYFQVFGKPLQELAMSSANKLSIGEHNLADKLTDITRLKRKQQSPDNSPYKQATAAEVVGGNTLSATTSLYRSYLLGIPVGQKPTLGQEALPIDLERVRALADQTKNFTPAALLRLDEFLQGHGWNTAQCPHGFDRSVLREPPTDINYTSDLGSAHPLREERFGCEALFTGRLLVTVATDIFPQTLEQASTIKPIDLAHRLIA